MASPEEPPSSTLSLERGRRSHRVIILLAFGLIPTSLSAQAWLFPQGEGSVSFYSQYLYTNQHASYTGQTFNLGQIFSESLIMDTDYSLTNKLAVRVALPYIFGKYDGTHPHPTTPDNGDWHSTFQNFTADLRYNVSSRRVVFTPFVRLVMPSHNYEYFAHAAVGRDLREYHVGFNIARRLDPILPKAFLQAQYSYAFVERVLNIAPNRSNVDAQIGYFLTPRLTLLASTQWIHTYSGVNANFDLPQAGLSGEQWLHHDQISKATLTDVGGGFSFAVNRKVEMFVSFARSVEGTNGHLHDALVTIGVSRTFSTKFGAEDPSTSTIAQGMPAPNQAIVCTCARK